jgi:hypothetical protein
VERSRVLIYCSREPGPCFGLCSCAGWPDRRHLRLGGVAAGCNDREHRISGAGSPGCWQPGGAKPRRLLDPCRPKSKATTTSAVVSEYCSSTAYCSAPCEAGNVPDATSGIAAVLKPDHPAKCLQGLRPPEVAQQPGPPCVDAGRRSILCLRHSADRLGHPAESFFVT